MAGFEAIEALINSGIMSVIGDPFIAGILTLALFALFIFLGNTRFDVKIGVMTGASMLAVPLAPVLILPLGLGISVVGYFVIMKVISK